MSTLFRPMLACDADLEKLKFPLLASAKLDGVRAVVRGGVVYSRSNKPIPNKHVQTLFKPYEHYDGELIVGESFTDDVYRKTVSGVMSEDGEPDVRFHVFDHVQHVTKPYEERRNHINTAGKGKPTHVLEHVQYPILSLEELLGLEEDVLELGYEGLILRDPNAPYKMGRSTVREGYLLKLKRFKDDEAKVVGFEERQHNGNAATTNELGRTKRSAHKAGKSGRGDLGALVVEFNGVQFNIGTGFTDEERREVWDNRSDYLGQLAKFKYFPVGVKEAPRHPVFLGWRDRRDV